MTTLINVGKKIVTSILHLAPERGGDGIGLGSQQEVGEQRAGSGILKGARAGRNRKKLQHCTTFCTRNAKRPQPTCKGWGPGGSKRCTKLEV